MNYATRLRELCASYPEDVRQIAFEEFRKFQEGNIRVTRVEVDRATRDQKGVTAHEDGRFWYVTLTHDFAGLVGDTYDVPMIGMEDFYDAVKAALERHGA